MTDILLKRLEALREITKLSPVDYIRIASARKKENRFGSLHERFESEIDYSSAEELEYFLRFQKFAYMIEPTWHEYTKVEHDCFSLIEFAENALDDFALEREAVKSRKR